MWQAIGSIFGSLTDYKEADQDIQYGFLGDLSRVDLDSRKSNVTTYVVLGVIAVVLIVVIIKIL